MLEAVGEARQDDFGLVAVAGGVASQHQKGFAGQVAQIGIASDGDYMGSESGVAAVPGAIPAEGQLAGDIVVGGGHILEVHKVRHSHISTVVDTHDGESGVGAVGVGGYEGEGVDSRMGVVKS